MCSVFTVRASVGAVLSAQLFPQEAWLILVQLKTVDLEHHYRSVCVVPGFQETLLVIMNTKGLYFFFVDWTLKSPVATQAGNRPPTLSRQNDLCRILISDI